MVMSRPRAMSRQNNLRLRTASVWKVTAFSCSLDTSIIPMAVISFPSVDDLAACIIFCRIANRRNTASRCILLDSSSSSRRAARRSSLSTNRARDTSQREVYVAPTCRSSDATRMRLMSVMLSRRRCPSSTREASSASISPHCSTPKQTPRLACPPRPSWVKKLSTMLAAIIPRTPEVFATRSEMPCGGWDESGAPERAAGETLSRKPGRANTPVSWTAIRGLVRRGVGTSGSGSTTLVWPSVKRVASRWRACLSTMCRRR
mmetsp:Transcript_14010/g.32615  ORF Transcript_14010/g.32615 Transcript_14010/m.32615 type:complete len:261 (+) Transcript_14010:1703-2485(+)